MRNLEMAERIGSAPVSYPFSLVCCAHALLFDQHVHEGTRFVVSGGGGMGLCSHFRGICAAGEGHPPDRGSLFHAVEIVVAEDGSMTGHVHQAFGGVRFTFRSASWDG